MTDTGKTPAQRLLGETAPELVRLTDEVLFGQVWSDPGLSPRDRSLVTVAALVSLYRTEQLGSHLRRALDNGAEQGRARPGHHASGLLRRLALRDERDDRTQEDHRGAMRSSPHTGIQGGDAAAA